MKKIISLVLCLMMVLGMAAPVFADSDHIHTITVMNSNEGYVYEAYQIFSGDLSSDGKLSNIEWGNGINGPALLAELKNLAEFSNCNDAEDVATALSHDTTPDNVFAQNFAEIAAKHVTTPSGTSQYADGKYTIDVNGDGYYLVVNTQVPDGTDAAYSRYVLEVVRNVTVAHKGDFPTVEKRIIEDGEKVTVNEASIGDTIRYAIQGTLPSDIAAYDTYFYRFTDTMSKGLTFDEATADLSVKVNGVDVTKYFYISATEYDPVNGTVLTVAIQDLLALELVEGVGEITKDTKILLAYNVTLNENAVIGNANNNTGNPNKVDLEYSNNPNEDGEGATTPPPENPDEPTPEQPTGKTPEKEVTTYTTELLIQKVDGQGNALTGAEFTLTGEGVNVVIVTGQYFEFAGEGLGEYYKLENGTYTTVAPVFEDDPATEDVNEKTDNYYASLTPDYVLETKVTIESRDGEAVSVKGFVDENGQLKFTGLGVGTYTLTETVTPQGYNTIDPITFTVSFNPETKTFSTGESTQVLVNGATNTLFSEVVNISGSTLPSTGGMGTTLFYIFGGIMVLAAVVLLVTKKRMAV